MGHYRSEMGYEAEDERAERIRAERHRKTTEYIQGEINQRGIAAVLADLALDGETMFAIKYRRS